MRERERERERKRERERERKRELDKLDSFSYFSSLVSIISHLYLISSRVYCLIASFRSSWPNASVFAVAKRRPKIS